jgi:hypothetical protein
MLIMPHSIGVNPADGAIWVTDVGLHQALKFDEHGKQLLAIGQRLQPGHDAAHLCKPTAVSVHHWDVDQQKQLGTWQLDG